MRLIFKVFVVILSSVFWISAEADILLTFGTYTSDKPTTMVKKFRPILNALEKELEALTEEKVKIKLHIARSYQKGIENVVNGKVDIARLGPASYIEAKKLSAGLDILAMESNKGKKRFKGVICVKKDSKINKVSELKGRSFAFGNQKSTIGRYLSQAYLIKHSIYAEDLSLFEYLSRHDKVGYAVANGSFDAGALKESTFNKLIKKGKPLKKLAVFENVTKPWVAKSGMPDSLKQKITQALMNIKSKKVLKSLKKDGFVSGADKDYDFVRKAIVDNHQFFSGH